MNAEASIFVKKHLSDRLTAALLKYTYHNLCKQGRIQGPGCSLGRVHVAPLTYVVFSLKTMILIRQNEA